MDIFGSAWEGHWDKIKSDWDSRVGDDDLVLIAGDISWAMKLEDAVKDLKEISERKGIKILTRGNHDYWWASIGKIRAALPPGMYVIQNDAVRIGEYIICGTRGWTVVEPGVKSDAETEKLYERERQRLEMSLIAAEKLKEVNGKIIAMIHFPPFNSRFEDSEYTKLFQKFNVSAVVYGHLHGETSRFKLKYMKAGIPYFLTSCDKLGNTLLNLTEAAELPNGNEL